MIELHRLPDWRGRLNAFINGVRHRPHALGGNDCFLGLMAGAVTAVTGEDIVAGFRGRYTTDEEALGVIAADGHAELPDLVASLLPEHAHASVARVGDIAAVPISGSFGWALGVVNGERIFVQRHDGLGTVAFLTARRAFRVG